MCSKANNKEFWDERYLNKTMPWDINQVAPAFVKYFSKSKLNGSKIAVLGSGRGHDAFFIANIKEGSPNVYGFDFSSFAVEFCNSIKIKEKLQNVSFYNVDFFELVKDKKWKNYFDYVIEHTSLCAIDPNRRTEYANLIHYLLKPQGKLIGLFFIRPKKLGGPPFGMEPIEVKELFKERFTEIKELYLEECLHGDLLQGEEYFGVFEKR